MHTILLQSAEPYRIPIYRIPASGQPRHATVLILPALGIAARFYAAFAQSLADHGLDVVIMEQRGHGASALRPSRQCDFGFREYLTTDLSTTLDWIANATPQQPCFVLGHSLGGHLATMACGLFPDRIAGLILSACASPWIPQYPPSMRGKLHVLSAAVTLSTALLGYYPGQRLGFGGREARTLMRDWQHMLRTNHYVARGLNSDLDVAVSQYTGPVLSLRYADDAFAPAAATLAVTDKLCRAHLSQACIDTSAYSRRADHYQWVREPQPAISRIVDWLDSLKMA